MEAVSFKMPDTLEEDELLRLPATWEEYLEVAEESSHTVQFLNDEIIVIQATSTHEALVIRIGALLLAYFDNLADSYQVFGSNVKIVVVERQSDFNADVSVAKEPLEHSTTPAGRSSKTLVKNPEIVVEVLSKSTRKFDLTEKITYYKLIPSLQYILFVDQYRPFASVYARTGVPDEWLNHDYRTLDSVVRMGDLELPMAAIYRKMVFGA